MRDATVDRRAVLRHRFRRHELDRPPGTVRGPAGLALLDYGVQDTGPGGAAWALANRGAPGVSPDELAFAWTVRGAPHAYPRSALGAVAVATAPFSEGDAAKRIVAAAKPLKAAGIPALDALKVVARHMRAIVTKPTVKGDVSGRLTEVLDEPYLRFCRPCGVTHVYEMPFRLAALHAGLELEPGTSPPVLRRILELRPPRYAHLASDADARHDVIRNHLRFFAGARMRDVAGFLDAPLKDVAAHWPDDAVEVVVTDVSVASRKDARFVLAEDVDEMTATGPDAGAPAVRLLGPYDPYLQLRDRELLVSDAARRKDLWRVLGRPGAIVAGGEILGTWRPRASGRKITVRVEPWAAFRRRDRALVEEEAERLAASRDLELAAIDEA